jgi:nicotinamidase-related amidase
LKKKLHNQISYIGITGKWDVIVKKRKHEEFIGTNSDIILRTCDIRSLLFIRTATNICVESTLRSALTLGYFSILVSDTASPMGPSFIQDATFFNFQSALGWVIPSEKVLSAMRDIQSIHPGRY